VDLKRIISTFTYRIDVKPEGGFIARANDPSLPPLEATTRQELQQKIQTNISAALSQEFPGLSYSSGSREAKFDFHIEAKPGGGFTLRSSEPNATPIEGASHEEIARPFIEKLAGMVGNHFLSKELIESLVQQAGSGDVKVVVKRNIGFTVPPGSSNPFDNAQTFQPSGTLQPGANPGDILNPADSSPIARETSKSWPIVRFLLALLVIAALVYFFRQR
jgi:hypothetical protein